jgi:hypothetical protein
LGRFGLRAHNRRAVAFVRRLPYLRRPRGSAKSIRFRSRRDATRALRGHANATRTAP